jgi:hypothetical protein
MVVSKKLRSCRLLKAILPENDLGLVGRQELSIEGLSRMGSNID